jgi:hypothetical protein
MTEEDYQVLLANTQRNKTPEKPRQIPQKQRKVPPYRRAAGIMNKTEAFYASRVLDIQLHNREIHSWMFEPFKLTLTHNIPGGVNGMIYEPDFLVEYPDHLRIVEIKGARKAMKEDAWVKLKAACDRFPFFGFSIAFVNPKSGKIEEEKLT